MAEYTISNEEITVTIQSKGAELCSLQKNNREYMWEGDPKYWGRTSPVLFPFVGSLKNKEYFYDGKSYPMSQHGFARDQEFTLLKKSADSIWFELKADEKMLEAYPFRFCLEIGYTLDRSSVRVQWNVKNQDQKTMYYSIGAHPGFVCPRNKDEHQSDYFIKLMDGEKQPVTQIMRNPITEGGLVTNEPEECIAPDGYLEISEELFAQDALVIENNQIQAVALTDPKKNEYIRVEFEAPLAGIWTPPHKNAPFICIEPWYGRCDSASFDGELKDRQWGNTLAAGGMDHYSYLIAVCD